MTLLVASPAATLRKVLEDAQRQGFLGPTSVDDGVSHSRGFAWTVSEPRCVVDLGTGGGLPGLVLACRWRNADVVLVEAQQRRAVFLQRAVEWLDLGNRVQVVWTRAEQAGREKRFRGRCDLVVARSFGRPAVTAECAAPFLERGGRFVVSEPPSSDAERWPRSGLEQLGLESRASVRVGDTGRVSSYRVLYQRQLCPERFPRKAGIPTKRPLFS